MEGFVNIYVKKGYVQMWGLLEDQQFMYYKSFDVENQIPVDIQVKIVNYFDLIVS